MLIEAKTAPAPRPDSMTIFLRKFPIWQLYRFVRINIRMTLMILKSHGTKLPLEKEISTLPVRLKLPNK